jgi:hypothetical protein
MGQELEPDREWCWAMEQSASFLGWQIRDALKVERNRFLEGAEHLFEGTALDGDIEVEADRLPITVLAFGVAMQSSDANCQPFEHDPPGLESRL